MAKFILFLILLIPLTVAGNWLMGHPGHVTIDWLGYYIEINTVFAAVALAVVYIVALLVAMGLWQLATWPERRHARRRYRTMAKGLQQITHGLTALALGDESQAENALKKARGLLPGEPLPQLLTAQLLQRQGKQDAARTQFRQLLAHASTAKLATHRLIEQHLARKEWSEAATLAEDTRKDQPKDRWLALTLIDLYARLGDTGRILALTEGWHWQSPLTREERHRYAALGYYLSTHDASPRARQNALRHAYGYAPEFLPSTIAYADWLNGNNEGKRARKILLKLWQQAPSPLLIGPILGTLGHAPSKQHERLLKPFLRGDLAVHRLLAAQLALESGDPARAKDQAMEALAHEESRQACALIAEAEKQLTGPEAASQWLSRAMNAPAPQGWICQRCGTAHSQWQAHCSGCEAFDTLVYERPEARITSVELAVA